MAARTEDQAVADRIATTLRGLGFYVAAVPGTAGVEAREARRAAIDQAADFVVVLGRTACERLGHSDEPLNADLAYALRTNRVVVPICLPGVVVPVAADLPPDLRRLASVPAVRFDPARERESLSRVAHTLSSDAEVEERKLMRRARAMVWMVGLIALAVTAYFVIPPVYRVATAPRPKPAVAPFSLAWGGALQRQTADGLRVEMLAEQTPVRDGDRLALSFVPSAAGHVYVVRRAASGRVTVLFPPQAIRGASRVDAGRVYVVMADVGAVGGLVDPGPDSVIVVGSYDPLENLEELADADDDGGSVAERADLLSSTLEGLVDGRWRTSGRQVRTRDGHPIDPNVVALPAPPTAAVTLADGERLDVRLVAQRGLLSTVVEIRLVRR